MYSLVLKNARVIDGSGKPAETLDIAIEADLIVNLSPKIATKAAREIDCAGQIVAPGFIDAQNHSDTYWQIFDNPGLNSLLAQGYTTVLLGHCGASLAPILSPNALLSVQKWHALSGANINWQSFGEFADSMSGRGFGCNLASLVGYSTLRRGLIGDQVRHLEESEIKILKKALNESLAAGAFGLSSGLAYAHEINVSELELSEMAGAVAQSGALLSVHLRNEAGNLLESLGEALEIADHAGANLKISHLKIRGPNNWEKFEEAIDLLENASHKGQNVHYDVYPYDSVWQPLYAYLPKWAIGGGLKLLLKHFLDPVQKNKILEYLSNCGVDFKNMRVASTSNQVNMWGKEIRQIAKALNTSSEQAVLEIVKNGGHEILVFDKNLDYAQVQKFYLHPLALIATDGGGFTAPGPPKSAANGTWAKRLVHPRCFGAAAKFLREVQDENTLPLEQAIFKLTGQVAQKLGLYKRGLIQPDYYADLAVFDPKRIRGPASLENPYQYAEGVSCVIVNGKIALEAKMFSRRLSGRFLKRQS